MKQPNWCTKTFLACCCCSCGCVGAGHIINMYSQLSPPSVACCARQRQWLNVEKNRIPSAVSECQIALEKNPTFFACVGIFACARVFIRFVGAIFSAFLFFPDANTHPCESLSRQLSLLFFLSQYCTTFVCPFIRHSRSDAMLSNTYCVSFLYISAASI